LGRVVIDDKGVFPGCYFLRAFFRYEWPDDHILRCSHYAYTSSTFATASFVIMNLSYFSMSNTFIVFTSAVLIPGMFLADLSTFSFLLSSTMRAPLSTLSASSTLTICFVLMVSKFSWS